MIFDLKLFEGRTVSQPKTAAVEQSLDDHLRFGDYWIFEVTPDLTFDEVNGLKTLTQDRFIMALSIDAEGKPHKAAGYCLTRPTNEEKDWLDKQGIKPIFINETKKPS